MVEEADSQFGEAERDGGEYGAGGYANESGCNPRARIKAEEFASHKKARRCAYHRYRKDERRDDRGLSWDGTNRPVQKRRRVGGIKLRATFRASLIIKVLEVVVALAAMNRLAPDGLPKESPHPATPNDVPPGQLSHWDCREHARARGGGGGVGRFLTRDGVTGLRARPVAG